MRGLQKIYEQTFLTSSLGNEVRFLNINMICQANYQTITKIYKLGFLYFNTHKQSRQIRFNIGNLRYSRMYRGKNR